MLMGLDWDSGPPIRPIEDFQYRGEHSKFRVV